MARIALSMPDEPLDQREWLEGRIVGPDLPLLVAELLAIHPPGRRPSLEAILGRRRESVVVGGLRDLSDRRFRLLLRHPEALLDLQSLVLEACSPYWDGLLSRSEPAPGEAELRAALIAALPSPPMPPQSEDSPTKRRVLRWAVVASGIAAAILVGVYLANPRPQPQPEWAWLRPDLFANADTRGEYLRRIAAGAEDWQRRPSATREEYTTNLSRMRDGCTRIINDPHLSLPPDDREWLVGKCREWRDRFDEQFAAVRNLKPWEAERDKTDATVAKLIAALNGRAVAG